MEILGSTWFTNKDGTIGIVRVQTEYDGIRYFIGTVRPHGLQKDDEQTIAEWGSTFPFDAGDILFGVR